MIFRENIPPLSIVRRAKIIIFLFLFIANKTTDNAITSITRNIAINLHQMLDQNNLPEKVSAKKFYIM